MLRRLLIAFLLIVSLLPGAAAGELDVAIRAASGCATRHVGCQTGCECCQSQGLLTGAALSSPASCCFQQPLGNGERTPAPAMGLTALRGPAAPEPVNVDFTDGFLSTLASVPPGETRSGALPPPRFADAGPPRSPAPRDRSGVLLV